MATETVLAAPESGAPAPWPQEFRCAMPDDALQRTPAGTVLLFSRKEAPKVGKGVLVRVRGQLHVRRYGQHAEGWIAEADRAGYASFLPSDGAEVVAAVVGRMDGGV